jgi:hypothetical protein
VPATLPSIVSQTAGELNGIAAAQVEAIKAAVHAQSRMLTVMVEPVKRWVLAGNELQLYFDQRDRSLTEMVPRDQMEKLRAITSEVLGQPLRVCVRLESGAAAVREPAAAPDSARRAALRTEMEQDPVVRAMLERFGGHIRDVKPRGEE